MKIVAVGKSANRYFCLHVDETCSAVEVFDAGNGALIKSTVTREKESAIKIFAKCITKILYAESVELNKKIREYGGEMSAEKNGAKIGGFINEKYYSDNGVFSHVKHGRFFAAAPFV